MLRALVSAICVVLAISPALPASADEIYPIVFPVVGDNYFSDTYTSPRGGGRLHEATDIMAAKGTPVVAAANGTVTWMSRGTWQDCNGQISPSYSMRITHDDGYQSWYIHLNNDSPNTDDGLGQGYAPGIEEGSRVDAGQLIGWVGDSGNAECVASHLHFQLHYPDGTRFNPYESLLAAEQYHSAAADEIFFYRPDGNFGYFEVNSDATLGQPLAQGDHYTTGWSTITAIDLEGNGEDEMFFYRDDGLFRYYDIRPDGSIPAPMAAGDNYTVGWDSIAAIDLDGDGQDEFFFYRDDGLFRYYDIRADGRIPSPMSAGDNYTAGWTTITAIDLDGDGQDEIFFYRDDGLYRYYDIRADGSIPGPLSSGSDYEPGWTSITAIDVDGDGKDEMFFYKADGTYQYRRVSQNGELGAIVNSGSDYLPDWSSVASVNLGG